MAKKTLLKREKRRFCKNYLDVKISCKTLIDPDEKTRKEKTVLYSELERPSREFLELLPLLFVFLLKQSSTMEIWSRSYARVHSNSA